MICYSIKKIKKNLFTTKNKNKTEEYFLLNRASEASFLYYQLLFKVKSYEDAKEIVDILLNEYPTEPESIYGFVLLFSFIEKYLPQNILEIISSFNDFYNYFSKTKFFPYVCYCAANYLLKLKKECNIDYINFINNVIYHIEKIQNNLSINNNNKNMEFNDIIKKLKEKQSLYLTNLLKIYLNNGQIILLLKNSFNQLNQKIDTDIKLIYIIATYINLQAYEIAKYYISQLSEKRKNMFNNFPVINSTKSEWIGKTEEEISSIYCNRLYRDHHRYNKNDTETIIIYSKDLCFHVFILKNSVVTRFLNYENMKLSKSISDLIEKESKKITQK